MKKTITVALLALLALTGQAKVWKTIKAPTAMACVNVSDGVLSANEVVLTDTATTVRFTLDYPSGRTFRFAGGSYLADESGRKYRLRSVEGIRLDEYIPSPESRRTDFTMHFEPLPKQTRVFDFVEGDAQRAFMLLGIHDEKQKVRIPTTEELRRTYPCTVPADWLRTDTATIRGRIDDYDARRMGFSSMSGYCYDVFEKENGTMVLDIAEDGSFERRFPLSAPMRIVMENNSEANIRMPFFVRPGDTVDVTLRRDSDGDYRCLYNSGSSKEVERWLRTEMATAQLCRPLTWNREMKLAEAKPLAERAWQNIRYHIGMVARREGFTPLEVQLAIADAEVEFAMAWMTYLMYSRDERRQRVWKDDYCFFFNVTDSAEWAALTSPDAYGLLRDIDFDNPLHLVTNSYYFLINRIQYDAMAMSRCEEWLNGTADEDMTEWETEQNLLRVSDKAWRELLGSGHDNLAAQLCAYRNMLSEFNYWRQNEEDDIPECLADTTMTEAERKAFADSLATTDRMFPFYLSTFTHPYIRAKAEQFHAGQMMHQLTTPLPDGNPCADLIRSLVERYPGRYLILDFWGMGCGPCRAEIQESKDERAEIARRNDVKLIFIADELTPHGSEAYHKYVAEWLSDEETVCLSHSDFLHMQELFSFAGIPHHETITPDGRRVREDYAVRGLSHGLPTFNFSLQRLQEKITANP